MVQGTRLRLRDQINMPRNAPDQIRLAELLRLKVVEEAVSIVTAPVGELTRKQRPFSVRTLGTGPE